MLFNSSTFIVFLPVVVILYYLLNHKYRWFLLLAASYYFYMSWKASFIVLIALSTLVDYFVALKIHGSDSKRRKKELLWISLILNLGLLISFKYLDFIISNGNHVLSFLNVSTTIPYAELILPVGISFYTFQTLSYTLDVYNGKIDPERHLGKFAVFVSFFPQLVAGPIERAGKLLPQFSQKVVFNLENFKWGVTKMLYGFFKKVVIADRLSIYVNQVYSAPEDYSSTSMYVASVFFAFQVYCDFSGYSDIAIGSAKMLGVDLMENFKRPYLAKSLSDFWSRWHISLSTWFRDYVYIPLGGNRVVKWRWYYNLFATFVISGVWHGASWNFIIWGALHGGFQILENTVKQIKSGFLDFFKKLKLLRIFIVFHMVLFAWVFFVAKDLDTARTVLTKMIMFDFDFDPYKLYAFKGSLNFLLSWFCIGLLLLSYFLRIDLKMKNAYLFNLILLVLIFFLGKDGNAEFIYFQF
ncbi:MBOAT family O-acyltransferase [Parvicella tangerina]|uniref:Peptidoglycan O-acetyltransferase n=1 Tax=Parvicella tangerina TaxID=2829795 RepID=A0A916JL81_9FLAO|nr:MBOAT family O-acyltransferase [Parvicella tangerina]CAG5079767.1 Peptidoglycan O-acetyltransferase [Parvicella tangerina]